MGTRIHKAMGYGIIDLKKNDPRVNWDSFHKHVNDHHTFKQLVEWVLEHKDEIIAVEAREYPYINAVDSRSHFELNPKLWKNKIDDKTAKHEYVENVDRCLVHDSEFGLQRVMMIVPPDEPKWQRYDDDMDSYNAKFKAELKIQKHGFFPHNHGLLRFRKPAKPFTSDEMSWPFRHKDAFGPTFITGGDYSQLTGIWDKKLPPQAQARFLKHLKEDFRPNVPFGILAMILWSGIAAKPTEFIDSLRPVIYSYWS